MLCHNLYQRQEKVWNNLLCPQASTCGQCSAEESSNQSKTDALEGCAASSDSECDAPTAKIRRRAGGCCEEEASESAAEAAKAEQTPAKLADAFLAKIEQSQAPKGDAQTLSGTQCQENPSQAAEQQGCQDSTQTTSASISSLAENTSATAPRSAALFWLLAPPASCSLFDTFTTDDGMDRTAPDGEEDEVVGFQNWPASSAARECAALWLQPDAAAARACVPYTVRPHPQAAQTAASPARAGAATAHGSMYCGTKWAPSTPYPQTAGGIFSPAHLLPAADQAHDASGFHGTTDLSSPASDANAADMFCTPMASEPVITSGTASCSSTATGGLPWLAGTPGRASVDDCASDEDARTVFPVHHGDAEVDVLGPVDFMEVDEDCLQREVVSVTDIILNGPMPMAVNITAGECASINRTLLPVLEPDAYVLVLLACLFVLNLWSTSEPFPYYDSAL
jgi:hypothetical protein